MNIRNVIIRTKTHNVSRRGALTMNKKKIAFIGRAFDDNWELNDPTGKSDNDFKDIIRKIEEKILELKNCLQ